MQHMGVAALETGNVNIPFKKIRTQLDDRSHFGCMITCYQVLIEN